MRDRRRGPRMRCAGQVDESRAPLTSEHGPTLVFFLFFGRMDAKGNRAFAVGLGIFAIVRAL